MEAPRRVSGLFWYRIRFISGPPEVFPEPDLDRFSDHVTPHELFARSAFGDRDDIVRLVTFHKLNVPLDNTIYSFQSSRTEFYPHQYRPLIKFLDSKNHRLLIADEVGLGKTIEAGLILAELRARKALRQVMVVCPKALCLKWQEEMWRRFDEEFTICSASDIRRLIDALQERGETGDLRVIVPLQSLRRESLLELLEANRIPLDLVIVDEAHHVRNSGTLSHRAVAAVTEYADGVVLLTATPIQIGNENLFNLLRILDPHEFEDLETFQDRLEVNELVVEAERLIRSSFPPPLPEIHAQLRRLETGRAAVYFARNPLYHRIREDLEQAEATDRAEIARIQHDLKELSLLGHIFTRTRKREVFTHSAKRSPQVLHPAVTDEEERFYNLVTEFVRSTAQSNSGAIHQFAAIMAQRQVASCMQAARARFVQRAVERMNDLEESDLSEQFWFETEEQREERLSLPARVLDAAASLGTTDSKFESLLDALHALDKEVPGRKVLLFSYFRDTLTYLRGQLEAAGYPCELITGEVPSDPQNPERDERGLRMRRFRDDPEVRVLLSSEVGSEGLDFQFSHVLVNYDLPWNPMLVEQRIGRLDRLGQEAKRIVILNFSMRDTIEERILERLYNRIGIFERSIGDLEAILGDEIAKLTRDLLSQHLTPEEEADRIDQAAQAIEQRKIQIERLEEQAARFVGADSYFEEQLERARKGGELLAPGDLEAFLRAFLESHHPRTRLRPSGREGVYTIEVDSDLEVELRRQPGGSPKFRFLNRLAGGSAKVTFHAEVAFKDDTVELLAAHHPLMMLATEHYRRNAHEIHPVSALRVPAPEGITPGIYTYALFEVKIQAGRERKRLEPMFLSVQDGTVLSEGEGSILLGQMLRAGRKWAEVPHLEPEVAQALLQETDDQFLQRLSLRRQDLEIRNAAVVETRIASLQSAHEMRMQRKGDLLRNAQELGRQERYIRMLEGTIRNMTADYQQRVAELEAERSVRFSYNPVGCGLLNVETP
jgi:SNF2 family DNA or RNA helicase